MENNFETEQGLFEISKNQPEIPENEEKQEFGAKGKSFKCERGCQVKSGDWNVGVSQ